MIRSIVRGYAWGSFIGGSLGFWVLLATRHVVLASVCLFDVILARLVLDQKAWTR